MTSTINRSLPQIGDSSPNLETRRNFRRAATDIEALQALASPLSVTAYAAISQDRLVELDTSGHYVKGSVNSERVVGVNGNGEAVSESGDLDIKIGMNLDVVTSSPVKIGRPIKCADNGRVTELICAINAGQAIKSAVTGEAFTNQPANDGIEIVSSSVADTTQTVTLIGTTTGGVTVVVEDVALSGTTPVSAVKVDWGVLLAAKLSVACAGTITIREASGNATIVTIAPAATSAGVATVTAADQAAFNAAPSIVASGSSTKIGAVKYIATDGTTTAYMAVAFNGATAADLPAAANLVTEFYVGDLESSRTGTVAASTTLDAVTKKVGRALEAATAAGTTIAAQLAA